ncbi:olfactory receptor 5B21-like [Dendropsophus ebraccatus]|uniref:olfactory receptor 5B21-like n=1 Tax=Dendropsophus ebraccatus TaxID=150705 RepID=UPI00383168B2
MLILRGKKENKLSTGLDRYARKMEVTNLAINGFVLLGFYELPSFQLGLFLIFLVIYVGTLAGNSVTTALFCFDPHFYSPMYILLCNLSIIDMSFTTMVLPKLLDILLTGNHVISYNGCITQVFILIALIVLEVFILAAMAYYRYVAICHLLRYSYLMSLQEGRQKIFSTCSSHLTVILMFYGTVLGMYMRPKSSYSMDQDKVFAILYAGVIPMLNPLIYSLRNQEVKKALC